MFPARERGGITRSGRQKQPDKYIDEPVTDVGSWGSVLTGVHVEQASDLTLQIRSLQHSPSSPPLPLVTYVLCLPLSLPLPPLLWPNKYWWLLRGLRAHTRGGGCLCPQAHASTLQWGSELSLEDVLRALRAPAVNASEVSVESFLQVSRIGSQHLRFNKIAFFQLPED